MVRQKRFEPHAGHAFDDVCGQRGVDVRIRECGGILIEAGRQVAAQKWAERRARVRFRADATAAILKSSLMAQQASQGDRPIRRSWNVDVHVVTDVAIEIDAAGLDELHRRHRGEHLGDRADSRERLGRHDPSCRHVCVPIAAAQDDVTVFDDNHHSTRNPATFELLANEGIDESFHGGRRHRLGRITARTAGTLRSNGYSQDQEGKEETGSCQRSWTNESRPGCARHH